MLEFKKKVFEVNIYGDIQKINKPLGIQKQKVLNELAELNVKRANEENLNGDEEFAIFKKFVEQLGMKKDLFDQMYQEDQVELISYLLDVKKN